MPRRIFLLLVLAVFGKAPPLPALRLAADGNSVPDFADFRQSGHVVRAYSPNRELNHFGVTLQLTEKRVRALAAGKVYGTTKLRGYGRMLILDHGHGWHTLYSDMAEIRVKTGDLVQRGMVIGIPRQKRLFLVVSYKGNPINPSDVIQKQPRQAVSQVQRTTSRVWATAACAAKTHTG